MPLKIDKLFCFITGDDEGEGVAGFKSTHGWLPMVGADMARVDSLATLAQDIATRSNKTITLCEFSVRKEIKVIKPK